MDGRDAMLQAARSGARLSYDDLVAMFPHEDGLCRELIDGELFVTASPFTRHQRLVRRLALALGNHLDVHPDQGELFLAPMDVVMSPQDVVEPDLLVVLGDQQEILSDRHIHGAPGLVIEVHSPGTRKRDQTLKRDLFDRQGVREYWMVDPDRNQVIVYRRADDCSFKLQETPAQTLTTPLLPGWSLSLDRLFR